MPSIFKAVIFDHDGTLVDSEGCHCECWNSILAPYNIRLSMSEYCSRYNGLPTLETANQIRMRYNLKISADTLYNQKIEHLNRRLEASPFPLLPGATKILSWLAHHRIPLAIASGANRHEVERSVQAHQLDRFVSNISTKQDVTESKPAPDVYLHAASKLNLAPEHCIAIEDSDTGEASALSAGMHCLRICSAPVRDHEYKDLYAIQAQLAKALGLASGL